MERNLRHVGVPSSEITPEAVFLSRRQFLKVAGVVSATAFLAACGVKITAAGGPPSRAPTTTPVLTDELGGPANSIDQITHYNNYYEFSTNKLAVAPLSKTFKTSPWSVEIGGLVHNPKAYAIEDLLKFEQKERIYRLRCVEAWSMVIPWTGFELGELLKEAEPMASAKYVHFVTFMDRKQMPGEGDSLYPWPYREGLRLDEAMHRLTILATGLYGHALPNQDGAPIRLVVPWKYGFKSIKAIVKIELTEKQPETFWNDVAPREYGFYANVNPNVNTPHRSQAYERRIGELSRRPTLIFNGYGDEVAALYNGMDLSGFY
ncbi:MAG: protein-methionine-sulfoxide reductase catalytic subunit MsrP [Anaerolineales bacterium]|jgi:sulfoxide reductase catalytic subunit YedY